MVLRFKTHYVIKWGWWPWCSGVCFSHFTSTELHVHIAGVETPIVNYLLFSLAEIPWSWTKIKFWDVSVWIKIWKEEIERWVWSGSATGNAKLCKNSTDVSPWDCVWEHVLHLQGSGGKTHFLYFSCVSYYLGGALQAVCQWMGGHLPQNRL